MQTSSSNNSASALAGLGFAVALFVTLNFMYSVMVPKYRYIELQFSFHPADLGLINTFNKIN